MSLPEQRFAWQFDLAASPEALWPLVSDTNRLDRDLGLPHLERSPAPEGSLALARIRTRAAGFPMAWDEFPYDWIRPHRYGVRREFLSGPLRELRVLVELQPRDGGTTRLKYEIAMLPRGPLGAGLAFLQARLVFGPQLARVLRRYEASLDRRRAPLPLPAPTLALHARARLGTIHLALEKEGFDHAIVEKLSAAVLGADELDATRLRPYVFADREGLPRRRALELFLHATRAGLLDLRWDLLCPLCRGVAGGGSLSDVTAHAHCESCHADFDANFDQLVEISFRPNPAIRPVEARLYCAGNPQATPHVVFQLTLPPGETREVTSRLAGGRYRVRARGVPGAAYFHASATGPGKTSLRLGPGGWPGEEQEIGLSPTLALENANATPRALLLEPTEWRDDAATAADVIALQAFRDLFSGEALRPGEQISVGNLVVVFTDLRGSTRLYREIGDAPAFGHVMNHFDILRAAAASEGGAVVKTMGDAVLAVFRRPAAALAALERAARELAARKEGPPLVLKAGVHFGPCIAVTLNDRLDYFGSTVNAAARLVGLSKGGDLVVSEAVRADPEVAEQLARSPWSVTPETAFLKGFEDIRFPLHRLRPATAINSPLTPPAVS